MSVLSGLVDLDSPDPLEPLRRSASEPSRSTGLNVRSSDGRWLVGWSGRLDNLDELRRRFRLGVVDAPRFSAVAAAEALAAGGVEALGAFVGDFAMAAWDLRERRLWLARDAIGFRPMFYFRDAERLWFSTDMGLLVAGPARERQRAENAGYLAETLAGLVVTIDETPVDGVRRVLPAEALGFSAGRPDPVRVTLWRPPTDLPPRRCDAALIDEFRARFTAAVTDSVGGDRRVATELSGGLDSTAVSAVAGTVLGGPLDAYSIVYPSHPYGPGGALLDESAFIDRAVAASGARSVRFAPLESDGLSRESLLRVLTAHGELPDLPVTDALQFPLLTRAASDGHTAMLTGLGGDYWLSGSISRFPALLARGRLLAAWRFAREAARVDTLEATPAHFRAHVLSRLAPEWARALWHRRAPRPVWPDWIPAAFARDVSLGRRLQRLSARVPRVGDAVLQDSLLRLHLAENLLARESLFRAASDARIDVRHPMLDRRFVEFVLTLPDDLRLRGGVTRYILRRALADHLPPAIRDRRSKGDASMLTGVAIDTVLAGHTFAGARAARRGWIDAARIDAALTARRVARERAPRDANLDDERDDRLWAAVAVEMWLSARGA